MIIFRNEDFIVYNKPSGIQMHDKKHHTTTEDEKKPNKLYIQGFVSRVREELGLDKLYPVHRLDEGTSGCIIFALSSAVAAKFGVLFENKEIKKSYIALLNSKPKKKMGRVVGDMEKGRNGSWLLLRTKIKPAITIFRTCAFSALGQSFKFALVQPKTGKTHQIRVAMKSLSTPILGDARYKGATSDRMYLHAYRVSFILNGNNYAFQCMPQSGKFFQVDSVEAALITLADHI